MRQTLLAVVAAVTLLALGIPAAHAGSTCRWIHGWCPPGDGDGDGDDKSGQGGSSHAVPEPATLALLVGGIGAVGVAVRKRRKDR